LQHHRKTSFADRTSLDVTNIRKHLRPALAATRKGKVKGGANSLTRASPDRFAPRSFKQNASTPNQFAAMPPDLRAGVDASCRTAHAAAAPRRRQSLCIGNDRLCATACSQAVQVDNRDRNRLLQTVWMASPYRCRRRRQGAAGMAEAVEPPSAEVMADKQLVGWSMCQPTWVHCWLVQQCTAHCWTSQQCTATVDEPAVYRHCWTSQQCHPATHPLHALDRPASRANARGRCRLDRNPPARRIARAG